ncbi:PhzF family phenazine biosynthesis protein [Variovorax dokdonensis]|uniref:PhzF family phenazine biosynthesis protein n=1 Tax=Variovorax dokdonensis TaxID=344883 RepID=A0ABT7NGK9_9BURK|nr:PhzF family phenazine biosynthesis protein [Variovorax dokdonensis]MDM0047079.1 PhzF family phenazine biosynthesis protein [Variovorax dokdonensis]
MRTRPFKQVDVFTDTPYLGNPVAVVLDGSDLDDDAMQRFARWTNLSETTFILPPTERGADYRIRIFTPGGELDFAGHPTLGTCHAWLAAGHAPARSGEVVQQCNAGLVRIRRVDTPAGGLAFEAPPLRRASPSPSVLAKVAAALNLRAQQMLAAQMLDNGTKWLGLLLQDADTVLALSPDHRQLRELGLKVGVAGLTSGQDAGLLIARANREARAFAGTEAQRRLPEQAQLEVRGFAAAIGVDEDPVTGSLNASLAQWLIADDRLPERYVAAQGQCLDRDGRVHIERDGSGQVWVGGGCALCIDGSVVL